MSDGLWNAGDQNEQLNQSGLCRHRILRVYTAVQPNTNAGRLCASGYASSTPAAAAAAAIGQGGPHFVMSPETPDGRPTLGFEWFLSVDGIGVADRAVAAAGDFTVTVWVLVGNTQDNNSGKSFFPTWTSFAASTNVGFNQLNHSFDVNATAIRFQVGNVLTNGAVLIFMCEL